MLSTDRWQMKCKLVHHTDLLAGFTGPDLTFSCKLSKFPFSNILLTGCCFVVKHWSRGFSLPTMELGVLLSCRSSQNHQEKANRAEHEEYSFVKWTITIRFFLDTGEEGWEEIEALLQCHPSSPSGGTAFHTTLNFPCSFQQTQGFF